MSSAAADSDEDKLGDVRDAFSALLGAERRLRGRDQHRQVEGLTMAQLRALWALDDREPATAGEIAKAARLSPAAVSGMLDELERGGTVTRMRSDSDRRRVLVTLTDEGRAVLKKRRRVWQKRWEKALEDMPRRDLAAAAEVMRRIGAMLDES